MSSYTGLSPKQPNRYVGKNVYLSSIVTRSREPTSADYRQPETGKLYPTGSFWLVGKDPTTGLEGDMWYLSKIVGNVAYWIMLSAPFLQSGFEAYLNASVTNVIGNSTTPYTIPFNATVYDIAGEFNTSTGFFTAAQSGYYFFTTSTRLINITAAMTECQMSLYAGGQILVYDYCNPGAIRSGGGFNPDMVGLTGSAVVRLTAGQTANIAVVVLNGAGATAGVYGHATAGYSFFSGYLISPT